MTSDQDARSALIEIAFHRSTDESLRNAIMDSPLPPQWRVSPAQRLVLWSRRSDTSLKYGIIVFSASVILLFLLLSETILISREMATVAILFLITMGVVIGMALATSYFCQQEVKRAAQELNPQESWE